MHLLRHAGLEEPVPYLIRGHPVLDVLARFGELRLPSVARLEFIPMKIGAGMTTFLDTVGLWTDTNYKLTQNIGEFYE